MEDLAVITAQNRKGSFGKYFVEFTKKKKNCYLPAKVGINCALSSVPVLKTLGIHTSMCNV